jgi:hypothetical protein
MGNFRHDTGTITGTAVSGHAAAVAQAVQRSEAETDQIMGRSPVARSDESDAAGVMLK